MILIGIEEKFGIDCFFLNLLYYYCILIVQNVARIPIEVNR